MCGIVGIFETREKRPVDRAMLLGMRDSLQHRGPDDAGSYFASGIGLGHRRLSIIDLSPSGHQPLFNEDRTICVTFNGEIYNYQQLIPLLSARGHVFRSRSDTEVIVHAWEEWGEDCVLHFQGMFAFAIWDEPKQILFLARDRFGEKPLYYSLLDDGQFLFASELKALLFNPSVRRRLEPRSVADYFAYGYVPEPRSIYQDIKKLSPAHCLTLTRGKTPKEPRAYWDVRFEGGAQKLDERAISEQLMTRLRDAVGLRMIADVPLGAFLSGGVDSSAVVAMMAAQSQKPVNTCSISFADRAFDESHYAATVADRFQTNHYARLAAADDFDLVDQLANFYDEPFSDSSALPTFLVCSTARERVTVALSGDGGDEVFAGYRRYYWHHHEEALRSRVSLAIRKPLFGAAAAIYPKLDWAPRVFRAKATLQNLARDASEAYFNSICAIPEMVRQRLFSSMFVRELQGYRPVDTLRGYMYRADTDDVLSQIQYADMKTYLPGDILTKVDRASMAVSLEVRVPLLDHEFVQWVCNLNSAMKLRGREGKYIFKKALERHLPKDILYRPKMGFAVPLRAWFRGALAERASEMVRSGALVESGMFDVSSLNTLVAQHRSGISDHSAALWSLMMFQLFLKNVHGEVAGGGRVNAPLSVS